MQLTRRKAILGMSVATLAATASSLPGVIGWLRPTFAAESRLSSAGHSEQLFDEQLRKELAQIASRADSEEGVPVLLACINQVPDPNTHKLLPARLMPWNASVAAAMHRNAAAWQRIRPSAPASDVAELIQILAERDLATGGLEPLA